MAPSKKKRKHETDADAPLLSPSEDALVGARGAAEVAVSEQEQHHDGDERRSSSTQGLSAAPRAQRAIEEALREELRVAKEEARVAKEEARVAKEVAKEEARVAKEVAKEEARVAKEEARVAKEEAKEEARVAKEEAKEKIRVAEEEAKEKIRVADEEAKEKIRVAEEEAKEGHLGSQIEANELPFLPDMTASSAHVVTGHEEAITKEQSIDNWISPQWDQLGKSVPYSRAPDVTVDSEGDTVHRVTSLLWAVLFALGLERHLAIHNNVTIMGVEGDIVVYWKFNKMAIGSFEVKKPIAKLPDSVYPFVAGQVFDQMHTYRLGGPDQVFSVLTTFNDWQLHSTHSLEDNTLVKDVLKNWKTKLQDNWEGKEKEPQSPTTSSDQAKKESSPEAFFIFKGHDQIETDGEEQGKTNKRVKGRNEIETDGKEQGKTNKRGKRHNQIETDGEEQGKTNKRGKGRNEIETDEKEQGKTNKRGKGRNQIETDGKEQGKTNKRGKGHKRGKKIGGIVRRELDLPREHYVSNVVSLLKQEDRGSDRSNCSKTVVDFIATAFLLMLESAKQRITPRISNKPLTGPVRYLGLGEKESFAFKAVTLPNGINLDLPVENNQLNFYVWFPLGFGRTATCCLASSANDSGKSCVVKFYHFPATMELPDAEAKNWQTITGKRVARSYRIPGTAKDKTAQGLLIMPYIHPIPEADRESLISQGRKGMLWKALHRMATKELFYKDGDIRWHHVGYLTSEHKEIGLCDFGHLRSVEKKDADGCVRKALKLLKSRCSTKENAPFSENRLAS